MDICRVPTLKYSAKPREQADLVIIERDSFLQEDGSFALPENFHGLNYLIFKSASSKMELGCFSL